MDYLTFILALFGLQVLCLFVGRQSSKGLTSQEDYFLAGRGVRFFPLMMTFLATQVGGGLILGAAEEAYRFGWSVLCYPLGAVLGLLLLGFGIGRRFSQFKVSTVAQILEVVYRAPILKKIASLLSIVTLFLIFVAQIVGSYKFMTSLGVENPVWFCAFWGIVITYTVLGGFKAVVATDVIQAAFFAVIFLLGFGYVVYAPTIPFFQVVEAGFTSADFSFDSSKLCGWLLMPLLFMVIEQDMGQRCFAAESPRTVSRATLWAAGCTLLISVVPIFFGILAKSIGIVIPTGASVFMMTVIKTTNPFLTALMGCAILAAIISTADSLINAIGSNLSQDFGFTFLRKNIRIAQGISTCIGLSGIFLSFFFDNIVDLLIQSYELSVSCLFVPIFLGLFKKRGNALSAALSLGTGAACFVGFKIFPPAFPREVLSVAASFCGYLLGEGLLWKQAKEVDEIVGLSTD